MALIAEAQVLVSEALGVRAADLDPVLYPPDSVQGSSGWLTLAVREGTAPAARLSMLMLDASTGWYYRGPVTVRYLGMFLPDLLDVPDDVVAYLAEQLDIDLTCVKSYTERNQTRYDHQNEIVRADGYASCAGAGAGSERGGSGAGRDRRACAAGGSGVRRAAPRGADGPVRHGAGASARDDAHHRLRCHR
ncbi:DUF4158 domain-containing protein [Nocardia sp. NBC_01730]|uniref:DUF4158 domain-containing protein n=1 Tax=Nocardia sp. NBC_01730 TaxID=2975998 RepID=UPI002E136DB3|nr:DUF4158 domain-containing protein [Nocardia sp. NBC_01730]